MNKSHDEVPKIFFFRVGDQRCSVRSFSRKCLQNLRENTCAAIFFLINFNPVAVYFHFLFYKLFLQKHLFTSVIQWSYSEKFHKIHRKTPVMELFSKYVSFNFVVKGLHHRFFVWILRSFQIICRITLGEWLCQF